MDSMLRAALFCLWALLASVPLHAQPVEEVPFITTPDHVTLAMLQLARVGAKDDVLDLGSGDGRIVITAARRFGARGHGVEIVPDLVERSRRNAERAGVADRATFAEADLFQTDLSRASVITMYLLPDVNLRLRPQLLALRPGTRIVSHDWDLGDWRPDRTRTVAVPDKAVGREKLSRLHLWTVPAVAQGLWCTTGSSMRLTQRYQFVEGVVEFGSDAYAVNGRLDGSRLRLDRARASALFATVQGERIVLARVPAKEQGRAVEFRRSDGTTCPVATKR
jgi:SAM-dependent methyltransferase